jgi:hypothetical protein
MGCGQKEAQSWKEVYRNDNKCSDIINLSDMGLSGTCYSDIVYQVQIETKS